MILKYVDSAFALNGKTELLNEIGELVYTCIYDFAYKNRIRILDNKNNELAYIQFKVISGVDQVTLYDKIDKPIAYIKDNTEVLLEDEWKISNDKVLTKDGKEVMNVVDNVITINNDNDILKCIMCLFVSNNK